MSMVYAPMWLMLCMGMFVFAFGVLIGAISK